MFRFFLLSALAVLVLNSVRYGETAPASYDQRQDGHLNVHAKLENLLFIVVPTKKQMNNLADLAGLLAGSRSEQSLMRHRIVLKGQQDEELDANADDAYRIEVVDLRTQAEDKKDNIDNKVLEIQEQKEETKIEENKVTKNAEEEKHKEPYRVEIVNLREDKIDAKEQEEKIEHPLESQKSATKEAENGSSIKLGTLALPLAGKEKSSMEELHKEPYKVEIINLDQTAENNGKDTAVEEPKFEVVIVEGAKDEARKAKQYGLFDTIRTMFENEQGHEHQFKNRMVNRAFKEVNVRSPVKTKKPEVDKKSTLKRKNENEESSSNGRRLKQHEPQELKLIGDGIENCGPLRHRNKAGICVFD